MLYSGNVILILLILIIILNTYIIINNNSPIVFILITIALMTVIVITSIDLFVLMTLVMSNFYHGFLCVYLNCYYKNLDSFKQVLACSTIDAVTPVQQIRTPLIATAVSATTPGRLV